MISNCTHLMLLRPVRCGETGWQFPASLSSADEVIPCQHAIEASSSPACVLRKAAMGADAHPEATHLPVLSDVPCVHGTYSRSYNVVRTHTSSMYCSYHVRWLYSRTSTAQYAVRTCSNQHGRAWGQIDPRPESPRTAHSERQGTVLTTPPATCASPARLSRTRYTMRARCTTVSATSSRPRVLLREAMMRNSA
jgi:hypothetical protein